MAEKAMVLLSGGLDSSTLLAFIHEESELAPIAIFFDRGQRALEYERAAAERVCRRLETQLICVSIRDWRLGFSELGVKVSMLDVPRNAIMLLLAIPYARALECHRILIGSTTNDRALPDSTNQFVEQMNRLMEVLEQPVSFVAPFLNRKWDKAMVANWGRSNLGNDFIAMTRSCYESNETPCGRCAACRSRAQALGR